VHYSLSLVQDGKNMLPMIFWFLESFEYSRSNLVVEIEISHAFQEGIIFLLYKKKKEGID
jgi:hypothetical protein